MQLESVHLIFSNSESVGFNGRLNSILLKEMSISSCLPNSLLIVVFEFCLLFDVELKIIYQSKNDKSDILSFFSPFQISKDF